MYLWGTADKVVPWGVFLRSKPVWAIIVAHFCYNWGYYTLLAWLPSFFELSLGLNVESSSLLTLIPYLAMTAMTPFVGPVADGLVQKGWTVTNVRKLAQVFHPSSSLLILMKLSGGHAYFHIYTSQLDCGPVTCCTPSLLHGGGNLLCGHTWLQPLLELVTTDRREWHLRALPCA